MKRTYLARGFVGISALSLIGTVLAFASCAETDTNGNIGPEDREASVPPPPGNDAGDAAADGACDPSDPECVTHEASCDEVDWCSVTTTVSPYHVLTGIWGTGPSDVWAVGSGGTILHYDGTTWTPTPTGLKNTFYSVWGSGPTDIYAVSSTEVIVHGTGFVGGNAKWTVVPTDVGAAGATWVRALWGSGPNDVRIGGRAYNFDDPLSDEDTGDQFTKYVDDDGGIRWQGRVGTGSINGIWGSSADDVWMVVDNSTYVPYQRALTLHGTVADGGSGKDGGHPAGATPDRLTWKEIDSQANVPLEAVWGSSAADVWTVGTLGTIRHITPTDVRWQKVESPTSATLHSIWGTGPSDIWAIGETGTILHNDGTGFKPSSAQFKIGRKPNLHGVWGSSKDDVWIVGDGIVLHYTGKKGGR